MTLPEIPDDAWRVHRDAYIEAIPRNVSPDHHDTSKVSIDSGVCLAAALEAAWPHLYAAALRDAADWCDWLAKSTPGGVTGSHCASDLRKRADEAVPAEGA